MQCSHLPLLGQNRAFSPTVHTGKVPGVSLLLFPFFWVFIAKNKLLLHPSKLLGASVSDSHRMGDLVLQRPCWKEQELGSALIYPCEQLLAGDSLSGRPEQESTMLG